MRIGADVRRLSADDDVPPRGLVECRGTIRDPLVRGRAFFERVEVSCQHRGELVSAGVCLRCESFASLETTGSAGVVVRCHLRPDQNIDSLMTPSTAFAVVSPYTRVTDAAGYADFLQLDYLLVATDDALVGVVCRCQLGDTSDTALVAERMVSELWSIELSASLDDAAAALITSGGRLLCVVDEGEEVIGLLTAGDFARVAIELDIPHAPRRCERCGASPIDLQ